MASDSSDDKNVYLSLLRKKHEIATAILKIFRHLI